eukprot:GCRY01004582.1.p1 GENE.GCRY01004582.1~~GCRY01004582.1.p1  ORF type:complete len:427 (-),score=66.73 GCRY01004582.1:70-1350(-)
MYSLCGCAFVCGCEWGARVAYSPWTLSGVLVFCVVPLQGCRYLLAVRPPTARLFYTCVCRWGILLILTSSVTWPLCRLPTLSHGDCGSLGARHGDQLNRYCLLGSGVRLVASVPGHYRGANPQQWWGLGRLAVLLRQLPLSSPSPSSPPLPSVPLSSDTATTPTAPPLSERYPCLTLQFSSLGWLSQKWFDDQFCRTMLTLPSLPSPPHLDLSSTPVLKREENEKSTAISKSGEKTSPPPLKGKRARSSPSRPSASVRIVWPSVNAVRQSFEGYEAGGSLCCNAKNIKPFLRSIMREWDGRLTARQLAMPHIKTYTRHSADGSRILWSLLTSANLSKSAWGEWIADGSLVVKSYELGVLFSSSPTNRLLSEQAKLSLEGREDGPSQHIPLPFSLPPLHSSSQQHYKPWVWDQPSSLLDSHGRVFTP